MTLRRSIFWLHLVLGVVCGAVIALMATTGMLMAFQAEILDFARGDTDRVEVPAAPAARIPVDTLVESARARRPGEQVSTVTVDADPRAAVIVAFGRGKPAECANPYTGEVREQGGARLAAAFKFIEGVHRWLALGGDGREVGKAITGACALAFLALSVSGLFLWWPRAWNARTLRPSLMLRRGARGRARDWNLHLVLGFWALPLLVLTSSTGVIISYRWATNLLYHAVGETPPPPRRGPGAEREKPSREARPEADDADRLTLDELVACAELEVPDWSRISVLIGERSGPAASALVTRARTLPLLASVTLSLDASTGAVLRREGFFDKSLGARLRASARYMHTGEAFGWPGKLLALGGAAVALVLVWTGFALAVRRFLPGRFRDKSENESVR